MSNVNNSTGVSGTRTYDRNASRVPSSNLGKDEFMQILASQLANQDPLEPMQDTEFIAQMAQFTSLEQMTTLNRTFELSQAYSMVGKMVTAEPIIDGVKQEIFGLVDYAYTMDGVNYLQIGDTSVPVSSVTGVADSSQYNGINSQLSELLLTSGNLIGKTVTALVESEEAESGYTTITGVVERVFIDDQKMLCATVGGTTVRLNMLTQISETAAAESATAAGASAVAGTSATAGTSAATGTSAAAVNTVTDTPEADIPLAEEPPEAEEPPLAEEPPEAEETPEPENPETE